MKHIYQRCNSDCFPTCIAMVANISYKKAIKLTHPFRFKRAPYFTTCKIGVRTLRYLGYKVRKRYITNFISLKVPAIIYLYFPEYDISHVVVWDPKQKKILDPDKNCHYSNKKYKKYTEFIWLLT